MGAFVSHRRLSTYVHYGWLIGLAACLGCGSAPPKAAPGQADYESGCQLLAEDELSKAVAAFDRAFKLNPQHAQAVFYRAQANQRLGNVDLAIAGYTQAIRLHQAITAKGHLGNGIQRGPVA